MKSQDDLRADLVRYFDNAFPKVQQDRWPFTVADLAGGIVATIGDYIAAMTECAICGHYTAQGLEVHAVCLDMLARSDAAR